VVAIPRVYLTPTELQGLPLGLALANQLSALPPGTLDQMLARASQRCDSYCEKRLQAPGSTTLAASAIAGASSISVASTATLDNLSEQAAILDLNRSNQETVIIQSGGVAVTSWQAPYPGTITLDPSTPLQFSHSQGATVTYCYKEVREAITASQSDPYSEALMSQAAQLALAHLPPIHLGLTRLVFLKSYPIINVFALEHAYSFDTTYNLIYNNADPSFTGQIIVEPAAGFVRFRVGTVVLPQGLCRTTYTGGFTSIPDDIKDAVAYYLADDLMRISNPYMATDTTQGKRRQAYNMQAGRTPNVQMAEAILEPYRRHV
jgi:hypothetical protein